MSPNRKLLELNIVKLRSEIWTLQNLACIGKESAFNDVAESGALAHLFLVLEERLQAVDGVIDLIGNYVAELKSVGQVEGGAA